MIRDSGRLKLHCGRCKYTVFRSHVPMLGVLCSVNKRHNQILNKPGKPERRLPAYLAPYLQGKRLPDTSPEWRKQFSWASFTKAGNRNKHPAG